MTERQSSENSSHRHSEADSEAWYHKAAKELLHRAASVGGSLPFLVIWYTIALTVMMGQYNAEAVAYSTEIERAQLWRGYDLGRAVLAGLAMVMWLSHVAVMMLGPRRWRSVRFVPRTIGASAAGVISYASFRLLAHTLAPLMPYPTFSWMAVLAALASGTVLSSAMMFWFIARRFPSKAAMKSEFRKETRVS